MEYTYTAPLFYCCPFHISDISEVVSHHKSSVMLKIKETLIQCLTNTVAQALPHKIALMLLWRLHHTEAQYCSYEGFTTKNLGDVQLQSSPKSLQTQPRGTPADHQASLANMRDVPVTVTFPFHLIWFWNRKQTRHMNQTMLYMRAGWSWAPIDEKTIFN